MQGALTVALFTSIALVPVGPDLATPSPPVTVTASPAASPGPEAPPSWLPGASPHPFVTGPRSMLRSSISGTLAIYAVWAGENVHYPSSFVADGRLTLDHFESLSESGGAIGLWRGDVTAPIDAKTSVSNGEQIPVETRLADGAAGIAYRDVGFTTTIVPHQLSDGTFLASIDVSFSHDQSAASHAGSRAIHTDALASEDQAVVLTGLFDRRTDAEMAQTFGLMRSVGDFFKQRRSKTALTTIVIVYALHPYLAPKPHQMLIPAEPDKAVSLLTK